MNIPLNKLSHSVYKSDISNLCMSLWKQANENKNQPTKQKQSHHSGNPTYGCSVHIPRTFTQPLNALF